MGEKKTTDVQSYLNESLGTVIDTCLLIAVLWATKKKKDSRELLSTEIMFTFQNNSTTAVYVIGKALPSLREASDRIHTDGQFLWYLRNRHCQSGLRL